MTQKIDTFSANSLRILETDPLEFRLKYINNLYLTPDTSKAKAGQNLHTYLCCYLKGHDMSKIESALCEADRNFIEKIKNYESVKTLQDAQKKDIEQPFYIKQAYRGSFIYLTGRFDAVLHPPTPEKTVHIYDWKTTSLPKTPEDDIQTVVYLYCASKLYNTKDISLTYVTLASNLTVTIPYNPDYDYLSRIGNIINKLEMP